MTDSIFGILGDALGEMLGDLPADSLEILDGSNFVSDAEVSAIVTEDMLAGIDPLEQSTAELLHSLDFADQTLNYGGDVGLSADLEGSGEGLADTGLLGITEAGNVGLGGFTALEAFGPAEGGIEDGLCGVLVHGAPESALVNYSHQTYSDTCAVMCQADIIEDLTGMPVSEEVARNIAIEQGSYSPGGGTAPEDVGKLLESFGIPTTRATGQSIEDLKDALDNGQQVIVGLDAEEIWNPGAIENDLSLNELMGVPDAGHAVRVTGIVENPETGATEVIINDPGVPDGAGCSVNLEHFEDAWDDVGCFACYTGEGAVGDGFDGALSAAGHDATGASLGGLDGPDEAKIPTPSYWYYGMWIAGLGALTLMKRSKNQGEGADDDFELTERLLDGPEGDK